MESNSAISAVEIQQDTQSVVETELETSIESSSVNRASGSETEFGDDDGENDVTNRELLNSQFSSTPIGIEANQEASPNTSEVQEWINTSVSEEEKPSKDNGNLSDEDVMKCAAVLFDAVQEHNFNATSEEDDQDQTVPTDNFKTNYVKDATHRLPLHLMTIIEVLCAQTTGTPLELYAGFQQIHIDILEQAVQMNAEQNQTDEENLNNLQSAIDSRRRAKPANLINLKDFRGGEYFSNIGIQFKPRTVSKKHIPIIQAVEELVNKHISEAFDKNSARIFWKFNFISKEIAECIEKYALDCSAEQVGKYDKRLRNAVSSILIRRCLRVLAHFGYPLRQEFLSEIDDFNGDILNQSITLSSQGSNIDEATPAELPSSQGSLGSSSQVELSFSISGNNSFSINPVDELQNSPGFEEFVRQNVETSSPTDSWGTWSPSPPLSVYSSLPQRERSPTALNEYVDNSPTNLIHGEQLFSFSGNGFSSNSESEGSDGSDGGPPSRRRRLE